MLVNKEHELLFEDIHSDLAPWGKLENRWDRDIVGQAPIEVAAFINRGVVLVNRAFPKARERRH